MLEKLIKCEANIFCDLTEQDRGNITALMEWNRCATACGITELLMRSALANFDEAEPDENGYDFIGLEDGDVAHDSGDGNILNSNELRFQHRLAVLQKHCDDIVQVAIDLIQRFSLGVSAGKSGDKTDEQAGLRAPFNYRRIDFHDELRNAQVA